MSNPTFASAGACSCSQPLAARIGSAGLLAGNVTAAPSEHCRRLPEAKVPLAWARYGLSIRAVPLDRSFCWPVAPRIPLDVTRLSRPQEE